MILFGRGTTPAFRTTDSRTILLTLPGLRRREAVDPSMGAVGAFNATSGGEAHRIGRAYAFVDMNSGHYALNRPL